MRILRSILVFFMLLGVMGGPWPAMQIVAWTTMLATNLRAHTLSQAVTRTFDGRHPCSLCKAIAAGTKSESKSEPAPPVIRQEFVPMSQSIAIVVSHRATFRIAFAKIVQSLTDQPPTPPPRAFCA
jgi:hypothetical protein